MSTLKVFEERSAPTCGDRNRHSEAGKPAQNLGQGKHHGRPEHPQAESPVLVRNPWFRSASPAVRKDPTLTPALFRHAKRGKVERRVQVFGRVVFIILQGLGIDAPGVLAQSANRRNKPRSVESPTWNLPWVSQS